MTLTVEQAEELGRCYAEPEYFVAHYCQIYDSVTSDWIPFDLWPEQRQVLRVIHGSQLTIILKARQIGLTWLCLGYALWQMLFRPIASIALFSRRDTEALYLAGSDRMRGMYARLPDWLKSGHVADTDSGHEWILSTGSAVRAFPTSAGDSYVSTLALVDEADLCPDLNRLMRAVKPTIDNGGKLILLSRADKTKPQSEFKRIYRAAQAGENGWAHVFLPWDVHPARDAAWYERQKVDIQSRTGSLDDLHEQYPDSPTEALSPRTLDKRIPSPWIEACFAPLDPIDDPNAPSIPGLEIYQPPQPGRRYVIGADPAEGNPTSDDSALTVLDALSGEEVARLRGKIQPTVFAIYLIQLAIYYNNAAVMCERQNHGHAVIQYIKENSSLTILPGHDERAGWNSNSLGKALMYNETADAFRESALLTPPPVLLHSEDTYTQLASIEGSTLRAPSGDMDDLADSYALAVVGMTALAEHGAAGMRQARVAGRQASANLRTARRRVTQ